MQSHPGEHGDPLEMGRMLQLILGCAVNCENKQQYIEAIMNMEERVQKVIMEAIQELMLREGSPGALGEGRGGGGIGGLGGDLGPASFHPHMKQVLEQLETATQTRDDMVQRCHELEQQISVLSEEKRSLATENEKLVGQLDAWEIAGGELAGTSSTLRYRDLKKQIDSLQDELFKLETSRDEYRSRAEDLERANQEVMQRNEELQTLAAEARTLKDEVDALREMSERAVVYEGTMETYKKKLEELSDLRRQVRILEEKNSDYMQHNMELEEEVKKSGTWRPQLELYKKQVGELHQRLAEEAKNTDRQAFENKKLAEKMEALTQEKDRLAKERDALKETMEELRCHISALTSPDTTASSRPPSDLSDVDLLDVVPHEVRERLIRLQHENSMLKQRAAEGGGSSEQVPVLQTMVSDLQERQASLTHENRWEVNGEVSDGRRKGSGSPPIFPLGFPLFGELGRKYSGSVSPPAFLDSRLSPDMSRKLRIFRKNLKWASESDLLVLRQPKGLLSTNFLTSTLPSLQPRSLPPVLPAVTSSSLATQTTKEAPIVIRHIHEFKMSPSPTNEDSGCCRTSPSSCEETGEGQTPDFPTGTLDSGISGIYSGTLESGISGPYRCLSPVIPSIVEECTTHHVTDIIPALAGHRVSSPTVMHHSHPAHTSCTHCCSDTMEGSGRESGRAGCVSPLPPPPRPHSVCSYNPPYRYTHHTSLTPTAQSKHPTSSTSSPLQSPFNLTQTSPHTSLCLPATIIDFSLVHTQSIGSSLSRLTEDCTAQAIVSPISSPGQTSGNGALVSPQGRRASSGYSRPSLLPESPTPHNSPRLPNSIYATRTRSGKSLSSTALNETVVKDRPVTQAILVARSANPEKCTQPQPEVIKNNTDKPTSVKPEVNGHVVDPTSTSLPKIKETSSLLLTKCAPQKQEKDIKTGDVRKADVGKSPLTSLSPLPQKPMENYNNKPEKKNSSNSISTREKNQSKIITPVKAEVNRISKETNGVSKPGEVNTTTTNTTSTTEHRIPSYTGVRSTAGKNTGDVVTKPPSGNNSPALSSTRRSGEKKCPSPKNGSSLLSRDRGGSRRGSGSQNRSGNHVKFRDPVVSQVSQSGGDTPPAHYSPASPRERMSPPPKNPTQAKSLQPNESPRTQRSTPEVTLLSNTLFTRLEMTPSKSDAPRNSKSDVILPSATDTDTDLETLERKLTLGMYAAPLVSSESCTSVSPDDWEGDPSATDYCTDNGSDMEYDPRKFKPYGHIDRTGVAQAINLDVMDDTKREKPDMTAAVKSGKLAENVATLARTYSFFRHSNKVKKQRKVAVKEPIPIPPLTAHGGVVKTKNKTAKVMVAETLNAMFLFCTP
ncbi:hypothetical protein Pcinc_032218 [Petrolisthes cinctipes]|uniref:Uncharacterized protein n=1 Tax=Petrolisthes cinctipes TaxID=88211 RepID=A0AAE1EUY5_PETCI|nr:hypothetical protein Pcinc_032218 [Petrolisthes cinctipes]